MAKQKKPLKTQLLPWSNIGDQLVGQKICFMQGSNLETRGPGIVKRVLMVGVRSCCIELENGEEDTFEEAMWKSPQAFWLPHIVLDDPSEKCKWCGGACTC